MGKKFFIYLAALAAAVTVFASPVGLDLLSVDRPAAVHSANQPGGGVGP
jgi:hypothetical protein